MTGSAFLKRLTLGLDYLPEEERETVLRYYREKLSFADTISEEEEIVRSFGAPEHICKKLREAIEKKKGAAPDAALKVEEEDLTALPKAEADPSRVVPEDEDLTTIPAPERTESAEENPDAPEDVIFHKPAAEEEGHELVQSIEDHESFNLYGKKVDLKKDEEEIQLPAEEDDMTPEELEEAKQKALEKAAQFDEVLEEEEAGVQANQTGANTEGADVSSEDAGSEATAEDESAEKDPEIPDVIHPEPTAFYESDETFVSNAVYPDDEDEETEEDEEAIEDEEELTVTREYEGLFRKVFPGVDDKALLVLKIVFSVLLSPVLLLIFGVGLALYAGLTLIVAVTALILFLLMIAFIIGGVVELIYGITQLFHSVVIGLIEIGLGTILFGIVTAVVAMIYEFLFGVVPKAVKKLTALCVKYLRLLAAVIYGGRA